MRWPILDLIGNTKELVLYINLSNCSYTKTMSYSPLLHNYVLNLTQSCILHTNYYKLTIVLIFRVFNVFYPNTHTHTLSCTSTYTLTRKCARLWVFKILMNLITSEWSQTIKSITVITRSMRELGREVTSQSTTNAWPCKIT